jgi:pyruvate dehydrogenase E1 component beta subunit
MSDVQRECLRRYKDEFEEMRDTGIVSGNILNFLIGKYEGADVSIFCTGHLVWKSVLAAQALAERGISAEVIDLRTIRPLDWYTILESVKKTNRLVIVEEQWPFASVSSEITYRIQKEGFDYLDAPIRRITAADAPMHYAPNLVAAYLPDVPRTVKLVKEVMYIKK